MNTPRSTRRTPAATGHTISVVAERTGLSRDVLRVWERRYGAVAPGRTAGGQRLYSDEELERFRLLAELTRHGRTIGSVAGLGTEALARLAAGDAATRGTSPAGARTVGTPGLAAGVRRTVSAHLAVADEALAHARALDASSLERELRRAVGRYGLPVFLDAIVPAFMYRIGDEWAAGRLSIPHEHLASAVVLAILLDAVRAIPETPGAPRLLVATPAGEQHVVGAALIAAAAALDGWSILFLGANVPAADVAMAAEGVQAVALSVVHTDDASHMVGEVLAARRALPPTVPLIIGGAAAVRMRDALGVAGVYVCRDLAEARAVFAQIVAQR